MKMSQNTGALRHDMRAAEMGWGCEGVQAPCQGHTAAYGTKRADDSPAPWLVVFFGPAVCLDEFSLPGFFDEVLQAFCEVFVASACPFDVGYA